MVNKLIEIDLHDLDLHDLDRSPRTPIAILLAKTERLSAEIQIQHPQRSQKWQQINIACFWTVATLHRLKSVWSHTCILSVRGWQIICPAIYIPCWTFRQRAECAFLIKPLQNRICCRLHLQFKHGNVGLFRSGRYNSECQIEMKLATECDCS